MPNRELLNSLSSKEIQNLEILLSFKVQKTALTLNELIQIALNNGISREALEQQLIGDLLEGGRIFGEFRSAIKATTNGTINRLRDIAEFSELGTDITYKWVAVLVNTCQDCLDRHNTGGLTWEEWESVGLPRTGMTICKENCRCVLIPEDTVNVEPIKRPKGRR